MSLLQGRSLVLTVFVASLLAPVLASAQSPVAPRVVTPRDQSFTFGDELVQSSLRRPDMATTRLRAAHAGPSLIRHRAHFVPEMLHSVEQL